MIQCHHNLTLFELENMAVLVRRPKSGFVLYPKDVDKRTVDGSARFRTKCDMLIGPCACGGVHQENDGWVLDILNDYEHTVETLVLYPNREGTVRMPRYWSRTHSSHNAYCDILHGPCNCGKIHKASEPWVKQLLIDHFAIIYGHTNPTLEELCVSESVSEQNASLLGCDCALCHEVRRNQPSRAYSSLNRSEI